MSGLSSCPLLSPLRCYPFPSCMGCLLWHHSCPDHSQPHLQPLTCSVPALKPSHHSCPSPDCLSSCHAQDLSVPSLFVLCYGTYLFWWLFLTVALLLFALAQVLYALQRAKIYFVFLLCLISLWNLPQFNFWSLCASVFLWTVSCSFLLCLLKPFNLFDTSYVFVCTWVQKLSSLQYNLAKHWPSSTAGLLNELQAQGHAIREKKRQAKEVTSLLWRLNLQPVSFRSFEYRF